LNPPQDPVRCTATIVNERGLHARAAAKFVKLVEGFDATVTVERGGMSVGGLSIMGLMMFGAGPGTELQLAATGPDAEIVMTALADLIARGFDEDISFTAG
jgi:phosphocarrier protein HPr